MIFFLFVVHLHRYRDAKFWQNSGQLCDKRLLSKKLILAFLRTVIYQTLKSMQSHLYEEIKRLYQKPIF